MLCWLVVDDSDVIRRVARRILEDMNFLVLEADSGASALAQCARMMPNVIMLDWHMPDMSGHDVLNALQAIAAEQRPVVLYCTTENEPADLNRAFASGAQAYVLKPFNRAQIHTKIAEVVRLAA